MHLDLSDEEAAALTKELHNIVENDRYPFSPRIRTQRRHHAAGISAIPLLAKPFKVAELGRRIAEILHGSSSDDSATGGNAMH
jgi:hypothetical protein